MNPSLALIFHRDDSIFAEPTTASEIVNHRPREWKSWLVWTSKDFSSNEEKPISTPLHSLGNTIYATIPGNDAPLYYFIIRSGETTRNEDVEDRLCRDENENMPCEERKKRSEETLFIFSWKEGRIKDY